MKDIWLVCKKDLKELINARGGRRGFLIQLIFLTTVFAIFPLSQKELWMGGMMPVFFFAMIPLFLVSGVVADSFAGERERKTLETLLATRLPDWAIYLGKVATALIYSWLFVLLSMITSLVSLNLAGSSEGIYIFPSLTILAGLFGAILTGGFVAGIGVFISLRASSVQQASQMLVMPMWALMMVIGFGLPALTRVLPDGLRQEIIQWLAGIDLKLLGVALVAVILIVDVALLSMGVRRFKRSRLILD